MDKDLFKPTTTSTTLLDTKINNSIYGAMLVELGYKTGTHNYPIKKIIANKNATVVFFKDRTKVVVKKMKSDKDDLYAAVAQAVMKKMYGSTSAYHKQVEKLTKFQGIPYQN